MGNPILKFVPEWEGLQTVNGLFLASAIELGLVPVDRDRYLLLLKFNRLSFAAVVAGMVLALPLKQACFNGNIT